MRLFFIIERSGTIVSSPSSPITESAQKGCHNIGVRIEVSDTTRGYALCGTAEESYTDAELFIGLRVLAGESMNTLGSLGRVGRQTTQHPLWGSVIMGV
jgi:hypothetical protein